MKSSYLIPTPKVRTLRNKLKKHTMVKASFARYGDADKEISIARFDTPTENEGDADALAFVRDLLEDPRLVIYDEGNLYYMRKLYESLSDLEQKFRGAIRLRMVLSDSETDKQHVDDLEEKSFGDYCTTFFGDPAFLRRVKEIVNKNPFSAEKDHLLSLLGKEESSCLWDKHFGDSEMPSMRHHHHEVRHVRNDVMHVHLMTKREFRAAKKLIAEARNEIDAFIDKTARNAPADATSFAEDYAHAENLAAMSALEAIRSLGLTASQFADRFSMPSSSAAEAFASAGLAAESLAANVDLNTAYELMRKYIKNNDAIRNFVVHDKTVPTFSEEVDSSSGVN